MSGSVSVCAYVHVSMVPAEATGVQCPGAEAAGLCEPLGVSAGNRTQVHVLHRAAVSPVPTFIFLTF